MIYRRYVAIGDSSTEGLDDPDGRGGYRGWADRLAIMLARRNPALEYANLAVRGRTAGEILTEQLPAALALAPDIATAVAGMNDLLRPKFDAREVIGAVEQMHAALAETGATVVTITLPTPGPGMPLARLLVPRVARFNDALRASAARTGALVLDLGALPVAADPRLWSQDRLHANSAGHQRVAEGLAHLLNLPDADAGWAEPLPDLPRAPMHRALLADAAWARTHLLPWIGRRLRGETSGDGLTAKRPVPAPVTPD
jgi:lysophospholipase L1-like esterase